MYVKTLARCHIETITEQSFLLTLLEDSTIRHQK